MRLHDALKPIGILAGVCLAVVAAHGWQVAQGSDAPAAAVTAKVGPTGQLAVAPTGRFLRADGIRPGSARTGTFRVHNQTADRQALELRINPSVRDLDRLLMVSLRAGGRELFKGPLGGIRRWSRTRHTLAPTRSEAVMLRVWLPRGADGGWESRQVELSVELRPQESR